MYSPVTKVQILVSDAAHYESWHQIEVEMMKLFADLNHLVSLTMQ